MFFVLAHLSGALAAEPAPDSAPADNVTDKRTKKRRRARASGDALQPSPPEVPVAPEPDDGTTATWADVPPESWLPASGPVKGQIAGVPVQMRLISATLAKDGDRSELRLSLWQDPYQGFGDEVGWNQVELRIPDPKEGILRSEAPTRAAHLQRATGGPETAVNWQTGEVVWVMEITSFWTFPPQSHPSGRSLVGAVRGRIAVAMRDAWGHPETGFVAGTFDVDVFTE